MWRGRLDGNRSVERRRASKEEGAHIAGEAPPRRWPVSASRPEPDSQRESDPEGAPDSFDFQ